MANPGSKPLVRSDGVVAPQYFNERTERWEYITGRDGAMHYTDEFRSKQFFKYDNEPFPTNQALKGDVILVMDTSEILVYDGAGKWVTI